ncbi:putative membrane protein [Synechococcus sp. BIOS-E4-1]|uniref:hypothetical protein n=1 Tax=Synechococcus sp. BIOS-E4-1 TaxID=1400864 RepID=UPI001645E8CB|nr:hypothetical protein [Synechococcus sp. BIOS-E4-1]QNI53541.1 putative membrane protein [Synechococcus sp. BIOS-E4-1]
MKTPSDPKLLLKQNPRKGADMAALLLGAGIGYAINLSLPLLADVTISCIFLILLSRLRNRLKTPAQWWGSIGLCSGSFLGTASSMVYVMQRAGEVGSAYSPWERLALIVILGITGVLAGRHVGIDPDAVEGRSIGDLLRSLSGTFTGVFGVLVAIAFVFNGLEEARTLSSRLTTTLTIIILGLVGPGWISHRLKNHQRNQPH